MGITILLSILFICLTVVTVKQNSVEVREPWSNRYRCLIKNSTPYYYWHSDNKYSKRNVMLVNPAKYDGKLKCDSNYCLRKCCPDGQAVHYKIPKNSNNTVISPSFYCNSDNRSWTITDFPFIKRIHKNISTDLEILYGLPCKTEYGHDTFYSVKFQIRKSGVMKWRVNNKSYSRNISRYCIDHGLLEDNTGLKIFFKTVLFACPRQDIAFHKHYFPLSLISLFITLIVYSVLPELRNNIQGASLMSHTFSVFIANSILQFMPTNNVLPKLELYSSFRRWLLYNPCNKQVLFGCFYFIFYYCGYFWMNILCYHIWKTLRAVRPIKSSTQLLKNNKIKFFTYSLCIYCSPLLILLLIRNYTGRIFVQFDECFFNGSQYIQCRLFYLPLTISNLVNFCFFFMTICKIMKSWKHTKNSMSIRQTIKEKKKEYRRLSVYGKLFIVMGIPYILEYISSLFIKREFWYITDIIRSLQGSFVFVLFIMKKDILMSLYRKLIVDKWFDTIISALHSRTSKSTQNIEIENDKKY